MSNTHFVKLEQFEGPLDLLCHLIRVHELDIFKVDLFILTSQYLEYLRLIKFKDLKDASSFMELAASLVEIKSRYLLPSEERTAQAEGELDDDGEDPRFALQKRLYEFDIFRRAAEFLNEMPMTGVLLKSNCEMQRLAPLYKDVEAPLRGDRNILLVLYEQMLSTLSERRPVTVKATTETITLEEVIGKISDYIAKLRFVLFQKIYAKMTSRYELVAYILGALQMVRDRELKIYQEDLKGPIWLYQKDLDYTHLAAEWDSELAPQAELALKGTPDGLGLDSPSRDKQRDHTV